ncbi:carotenoid biosynthesis protein [Priestia koreensis]|uniref:carotenoid biosynthesis protein n=1 Tax=Priestia koreensis TaxID=284581 RepID=UPI0028F74448|nr:carotenoid biosynthesis protein [Priestia koreensis]
MANGVYRFFLIWYICGLLLVGFDILPPWLEWANAVFLYVSGLLAFIYLAKTYGKWLALGVSIFVMASSIFAEGLGVHYGLIFGQYHYEKDFGIQVYGVPLTIGTAWLMVVVTSRVIVRRMMPRAGWFFYTIITSILAVIMDLMIDPVAYVIKEYWVWSGTGAYYGIPLQNFFGWFFVSAVIQTVLYAVLKKRSSVHSETWEKRMVVLYILIVSMFGFISLMEGLYMALLVTGIPLLVMMSLYAKGVRQIDLSEKESIL